MSNTLIPRLTAWALALLLSPVAFGCWIAVAPEVLIDQADLIVRGEVVELIPVPGKPDPDLGGRQVAMIRVDAVLKDNAPPTDGKPPRTRVRMLQLAEVRLSTTLRYRVGTKATFMLTRDWSQPDAYRVVHPSCVSRAKPAELAKRVAARAKLAAGAAHAGLRARLELVSLPHANGKRLAARVSLENTTARPITFAYRGKPGMLQIRWNGGVAEPLQGRGSVTRLVIPPRSIRHLSSRVLPLGDQPAAPFASLTLTSDGAGVASAWRGTLTAPKVALR